MQLSRMQLSFNIIGNNLHSEPDSYERSRLAYCSFIENSKEGGVSFRDFLNFKNSSHEFVSGELCVFLFRIYVKKEEQTQENVLALELAQNASSSLIKTVS